MQNRRGRCGQKIFRPPAKATGGWGQVGLTTIRGRERPEHCLLQIQTFSYHTGLWPFRQLLFLASQVKSVKPVKSRQLVGLTSIRGRERPEHCLLQIQTSSFHTGQLPFSQLLFLASQVKSVRPVKLVRPVKSRQLVGLTSIRGRERPEHCLFQIQTSSYHTGQGLLGRYSML